MANSTLQSEAERLGFKPPASYRSFAPLAGPTIEAAEQRASEKMGLMYPAVDTQAAVVTTEPAMIPFTEKQFLGAGVATGRQVPVDWRLATPSVSVTDILPLDNPEYVETQFMKFDAFENAQGDTISLAGYDYAQRVSVADRFGATKMLRYEDDMSIDIPWERSITKFTRFPEEIDVGEAKLDIANMSFDQYRDMVLANRAFSTLTTPNPELGRAIHAQYINEVLIKNGVDARGRYMIINQAQQRPATDEAVRIGLGAVETIGGGIVETVLWGAGETAGFIGDMMGVNMSGTIADYQTRQTVVDNWWRPMSYEVQDYWAQQNVILDLADAEDITRMYTGFTPLLGQLAAEIVGPSKGVTAVQRFTGKKEVQLFEAYSANMLAKNKDLTQEELITGFLDMREQETWLKLPYREAARKKTYEQRLVTGFQLQDAALPAAERAEVMQQVKYLSGLHARRDGLTKAMIDAPTPKISSEIAKIDGLIGDATIELSKVERRSSIPKFIRDSRIQDTYITVGAASFGHFFGESGYADKDIGILAGMGTGMILYLSKGKFPAAYGFIASRVTSDERKKLSFAVQELQNASPEMQKMIELQAEKIAAYQDVLVAQGVNPEVLKVSLPIITDIVTLRHFENSLNQSIAAKASMSGKESEQIQEIYSLNQRLNGELNKVLADFETGTEADKEFFEMIRYFIDETKTARDRIGNDIEIMEREGVGHYMNILNGNTAALKHTSPLGVDDTTKFKSYPEALESLNRKTLIDYSALPTDEFKAQINVTNGVVNSQIELKANELVSRIGNEADARAVFSAEQSLNVDNNVTPSGLFSLHLHTKWSADKAIASRPYEYLKSEDVRFYDVQQNLLEGEPTVNVLDVIQSYFDVPVPGVGALSPISKTDISPADRKVIDNLTEEMTNPFFDALAQKNGVSKSQLLKDLRTEAEEAGVSFPKGRSSQSILAEHMVQQAAKAGVNLPFFDMNPAQLRRLEMATNDLQFKYRTSGETSDKLRNVETLISSKFDDFEVDGVPVGQIGIKDESGNIVSFKQYLDDANEGWKQYKQNWHDLSEDAVVPNLMSWGNQTKVPVTADNPAGVRFNKPVNQWLSVENMVDPAKSEALMLSLGRTLGQPVGSLGFRLIEGAADTKTAQAYVRAAVAQHISGLSKAGTNAKDLTKLAQDIENNIYMVDANGAKKPLISVAKIVDDTIGSLEKSVPKQVLDAANESLRIDINNAIRVATEPARKRKEALDDAVEVIRRADSIQLNAEDIGTYLVGGGRDRYTRIKKALNELQTEDGSLKYTPEEVNTIIRDAYLLDLRRRMFKPTGRKLVKRGQDSSGNPVMIESDELTEDIASLNLMLGRTDEQRRLVKDIIGEDTYEVWEATAGFMAELQGNPLAARGIVMKGVPRSLSVESYISRLYAINRGVVRVQYVGTEAALQQLRTRNFNFLQSVVTDPELGSLFLEMVRIGKPLTPARDARFRQLLLQTAALHSRIHGTEEKEVVDVTGQKFTVRATPAQKQRMGYEGDYTGRLNLPSLQPTP